MYRSAAILLTACIGFSASAKNIDDSALSNQVVQSESPYVPKDPRLAPYLEVSFKPELNTQVPLDLEFMGDDGVRSTLRDRMQDGKPAILALMYYRCPTMCNLMLNGMIDSLQEIHYEPGKDFNVIAVSFDHEETHVLAAAKKVNALNRFGETDESAWHFMVGKEPEVVELTRTVKFGFKYEPTEDQFAHGSGLLMLTPDGRISRFLPGVLYPKRDLQLSIVEAAEGKVGKISDKLALLCFNYDPETGKYTMMVDRTVKVACFATVGAVALLIGSLLRQERRNNKDR